MLGMNATCACPFLTQHEPLFCPPERRGLRNAEHWQDLRPMHDSRDLDAKKGASLERFARYVSEIAQRQGDTHKTIVLGSPKQRSNQPVTKTIPARAPILTA